MFNFEKANLSLNYSPIFFILSLLLLAGYAFYVYKYTIPQVNPARKYTLLALRILALLLLIFVFFEPTLTLANKKTLNPINLIFTDNSRSISIKDGTDREGTVKSFLKDFKGSGLMENSELFSFGNKVDQIPADSLIKINFSEGNTNFSEIFSNAKKNEQNISSVTIVSDGDITEGSDPTYDAEKLDIPVFTIGIGDTTHKKDLEIKNVLTNEFIYSGTPTTVSAVLLNNGYSNENADVTFEENGKPISRKTIKLSSNGIQNVDFTYKPESSGEKKLTFSVSNLKDESTYENNKKIVYVKVLDSKIKVLIIGGAPSEDISFLKSSLSENKDYEINSITQIGNGNYLEKENRQNLIDSANVLFLINFPTTGTSEDFLRDIKNAIINKNKPFFINISAQTDLNKLREFESELPFSVSNPSTDYFQVQPNIQSNESENPLIQNNSENPADAWNNLPPVFQLNADYKAKPESEIIAKEKINNVPVNSPLILTRRLGNKRSIAVLAKDIWKWKLSSAEKNLNLFDEFINNSVKWLNSYNQNKQVTIKTNKKNYSMGEDVDFTAQVYDEAYNPVSDAEVKININSKGENNELTLNSLGNGLYQGSAQLNKAGDYSFSGSAARNKKEMGTDKGSFNVGEVDIEMMNPRMNYEFLKLLSKETGGEFYFNKNYGDLFKKLKDLNKKSSKEKIITSEFSLWSNEWLMALAILCFAVEWFLRKRYGML
jgi:CARDB